MPPPTLAVTVRDANPADHAVVAEFNRRLAWESESKALDPRVLARGVTLALAEPDRLRYWLAVAADDGRPVGQVAVTREWSDWRNGWVWWLQSVYVVADARRRGVVRALYSHVRSLALASPDVIGLRLYVEDNNADAQSTYRALGLVPGGYHVFEELWRERFLRPDD
jgi:GNAT superfamily N-acetyltransferase